MADTTYEFVSRTATCKRCGSTNVTWQQGKERAGKPTWYLTEVFMVNGEEKSDRRDFHSAYCNMASKHVTKQQQIIQDEIKTKREREAAHDKREQERRAAEADKLAAWYTMDEIAQDALIATLRRNIEREQDGLTMDYFTEYCRSLEKIEAWRSEIDMYLSDFDEDEGFEEIS